MNTSLQSAVAALEALGCHPTSTNGGSAYTARCPCHDDSTPSLSISTGEKQAVILHCHAGCDPRDIFKALGIQSNPTTDKRRIVATYDYHDAQGALISQKVRYEPKDFRQRWPDGKGGWLWKRPSNAPYTLYRLPELLAAIERGEPVYLVEGERDCDRLVALGLAATTNIEGAAKPDQKAKWRPDYTAQLSGAARVVLIPDNDEPGRAHMAHVAKALGQRARVVELPGLPEKGDVSNWLDQGHTADELRALADTAPISSTNHKTPVGVAVSPTTPSDPFQSLHYREDANGHKSLLKTLHNTVVLLSADPEWKGVIGFNEFRQCIEKRATTPYGSPPGAWQDCDTAETIIWLNQTHHVAFARDMIDMAVLTIAHRQAFNPAQDRLKTLAAQWDGQARLDSWLVDYVNAAVSDGNREYLAEIGDKWLKGVAARVLFPGCKRDDVLVLRGPQGWKKSTAAQAISDAILPDTFTDSVDLGNLAEAKIQIRGIVVAELGELSGLARAEVESIKAFVSTKQDHFREKFGRYAQDFPRTVSFVGSTNNQTFLKDPTGNRRWWPVTLAAPIDIPRLEAILPQLLGEAAWRVLNEQAAWHVTAEQALEQADRVREAHFEEDVWTDPVMRIVDGMESTGEFITIPAILDGMNIPRMQQSPNAKQRVAGVLKTHGYEEARKWIDKKANRSQRYWKKVFHLHSSMVPNGSQRNPRQIEAKVGNHWGTIEENPMVPNLPDSPEKGTIENGQWFREPLQRFPDKPMELLNKNQGNHWEPLEPLDSVYRKIENEESITCASPLSIRILALLRGQPAGFDTEEITRQVGNGKGASPDMVGMVLNQLALAGDVGRVNGRWVVSS